jgi:ClpP class serine protease
VQSGDDAERQRLVDRFGNLVALVREARASADTMNLLTYFRQKERCAEIVPLPRPRQSAKE